MTVRQSSGSPHARQAELQHTCLRRARQGVINTRTAWEMMAEKGVGGAVVASFAFGSDAAGCGPALLACTKT